MSDGYLTLEDGHVSLGGTLVPGVLVSMEVNGSVMFDEAGIDNLSGKKKTPMGWRDSFLSIQMSLLSDENTTCYEKLAVISGIFKWIDNKRNPKIYDIKNRHAAARDVYQVVFNDLWSAETNEDDVIMAGLGFEEHDPPTIPAEIQASAAQAKAAKAPAVTAADEDEALVDSAVSKDTVSPFAAGYSAGVS